MANQNIVVGGIHHNSMNGAYNLLHKLNTGIQTAATSGERIDLVVAPTSALIAESATKEKRPNNYDERKKIINSLISLSKIHDQTYFLAGSMFWFEHDKDTDSYKTYASAPLIYDGKIINEFFKERINGEDWAAEQFSMQMQRPVQHIKGDNSKNYFKLNDFVVAVELCGDHGNQSVRNSDLEIILAYDNKGGFYISPANDSWSRKAILCNGFNEECYAQSYDAESRQISWIEGKRFGDLELFNIGKSK